MKMASAPATSTTAPTAVARTMRVPLLIASSWQRLLAAAGDRHALNVGFCWRMIRRGILRRQPGGHGIHVGFRQSVCDALHAVGFGRLSASGAPARELGDDVGSAQADQPR